MAREMIAALLLALLIGLSLGFVGGGGSILTVPILVYVVGLEPRHAIATSLLVVGVTSSAAMLSHARQGHVNWRVGLFFGASSMAGAYVGGHLAYLLPSKLLLAGFTALTFVTGVAMMRQRGEPRERTPGAHGLAKATAVGVGIGLLTGLIGAGGGFVIVPALVFLAGLPMCTAVGTSLLVIALNSLAGLVGTLGHTAIPWHLALTVTAASVVGSLVGAAFARRVKPASLRTGFAWFVLAMAVVMIVNQFPSLWLLANGRLAHHLLSTSPARALVGGALIGLSASAILLLNGRIAGVSGILGGAIRPAKNDTAWRLAFLSGMLLGGAVLAAVYPAALPSVGSGVPLGLVAAAGLLVGVGTQLGSGCTSGHGVCGLSRASLRSFVATCTFLVAGGLSAFCVQHIVSRIR